MYLEFISDLKVHCCNYEEQESLLHMRIIARSPVYST